MFGHQFFGLVDQARRLVAGFGQVAFLLIVFGVFFAGRPSRCNVFVRQAARLFDPHGLLLVGRLVLCGDVENAVDVDVECDFDLGDTPGSWWDAVEVELSELSVVGGHLAFALVDLDGDGGLVVDGGREDLAPRCGDRGVAFDQAGHDAALGFDPQ